MLLQGPPLKSRWPLKQSGQLSGSFPPAVVSGDGTSLSIEHKTTLCLASGPRHSAQTYILDFRADQTLAPLNKAHAFVLHKAERGSWNTASVCRVCRSSPTRKSWWVSLLASRRSKHFEPYYFLFVHPAEVAGSCKSPMMVTRSE